MSPVAMREIKEQIETEYAEAQGPFIAEKVGAPEFTIIRTSGHALSEKGPTEAEIVSVREGIADFERGDFEDAREVSRRLRERCGI